MEDKNLVKTINKTNTRAKSKKKTTCKTCQKCGEINPVAKKICSCGNVFVARWKKNLNETPVVLTSKRLRGKPFSCGNFQSHSDEIQDEILDIILQDNNESVLDVNQKPFQSTEKNINCEDSKLPAQSSKSNDTQFENDSKENFALAKNLQNNVSLVNHSQCKTEPSIDLQDEMQFSINIINYPNCLISSNLANLSEQKNKMNVSEKQYPRRKRMKNSKYEPYFDVCDKKQLKSLRKNCKTNVTSQRRSSCSSSKGNLKLNTVRLCEDLLKIQSTKGQTIELGPQTPIDIHTEIIKALDNKIHAKSLLKSEEIVKAAIDPEDIRNESVMSNEEKIKLSDKQVLKSNSSASIVYAKNEKQSLSVAAMLKLKRKYNIKPKIRSKDLKLKRPVKKPTKRELQDTLNGDFQMSLSKNCFVRRPKNRKKSKLKSDVVIEKRTMGRPKNYAEIQEKLKDLVNNSSEKCSNFEKKEHNSSKLTPDCTLITAKRPMGRPRKYSKVDKSLSNDPIEKNATVVKEKQIDSIVQGQNFVSTKRPIGRPRKYPKVCETSSQNSNFASVKQPVEVTTENIQQNTVGEIVHDKFSLKSSSNLIDSIQDSNYLHLNVSYNVTGDFKLLKDSAKRPMGRPRKYPKVENQPKRPVGRPRKEILGENNKTIPRSIKKNLKMLIKERVEGSAIYQEDNILLPKKRGRPKGSRDTKPRKMRLDQYVTKVKIYDDNDPSKELYHSPSIRGGKMLLSPQSLINSSRIEHIKNERLTQNEDERLQRKLARGQYKIPEDKKEIFAIILKDINQKILSQNKMMIR